MKHFSKNKYLIFIITLILFIVPFFWLHPNEMDLGGDESRLFFYDPRQFLYNNGLFLKEIITLGNRSFDPFFDFIPFISILLLIKSVINSPYFLISLLNGIKVSVSFLAMYLVIKAILQNSYKERNEFFLQVPSILGGLLYTTAPIVIGNYEKALLSHDQIFLNPLCFYLILNYFIKGKFRYLLAFIILSLIFTTSFSWPSAPPIFAFFSLALLFLFFYVFLILRKKKNYSYLFIALLLFLGLHSFHIIPEVYSLLRPNSYINGRVFTSNGVSENLNYFYGVLPLSKLSFNLLLYAPFKQYVLLSFVPAFFLFLGLCFNKKNDKTVFLIGTFFLISLYLVTANITDIGIKLYTLFFFIPGFSMFRNFIGQWAFVYSFFYTLLFGLALYFLFKKINSIKVSVIIAVFIGISIIGNSWNFFAGDMVNTILFQTNGVKIPMVIDPNYEKTLAFIRTRKDDGAFISFPFTDSYETVIHGINNGAYEGLSPINWLVGRIDYNGYREISPFGEIFFKLVKEKNYNGIKKLLGILNVEYIYYNDDSNIYDKTFPGNPYTSTRVVFPRTQAEYKSLIEKIAGREIYHIGTYHIYKTDKNYFHPEFYAAGFVETYKTPQNEMYTQTEPFFNLSSKTNDIYIDDASCLKALAKSYCSEKGIPLFKMPQIQFEEVNPTMFHIRVLHASKPYLLIFSKSFDKDWNISLTQNNFWEDLFFPHRLEERHVLVNGYANAWYILPKDVENKSDYIFTVQMSDQKIFYIGASITLFTLLVAVISGLFFLSRK